MLARVDDVSNPVLHYRGDIQKVQQTDNRKGMKAHERRNFPRLFRDFESALKFSLVYFEIFWESSAAREILPRNSNPRAFAAPWLMP